MTDENPYEHVTEVKVRAEPSPHGSMTPVKATVRLSHRGIEKVIATFDGTTAVVSGVRPRSDGGSVALHPSDLGAVAEAEDALAELTCVQAVESFVGGDA